MNLGGAPNQIKLAITCDDGICYRMSFIISGRGNDLPYGARWLAPGVWLREPLEQTLDYEVKKTFADTTIDGVKVVRPKPLKWRIVDDTDFPTSKEFRTAWVDTGKMIGHDIDIVKRTILERVRLQRVAELAECDIEWMQAMGKKDYTRADDIEAQRQVLRDEPAELETALATVTTVNEAKSIVKKSKISVPVFVEPATISFG
jgi:hypothetical protein